MRILRFLFIFFLISQGTAVFSQTDSLQYKLNKLLDSEAYDSVQSILDNSLSKKTDDYSKTLFQLYSAKVALKKKSFENASTLANLSLEISKEKGFKTEEMEAYLVLGNIHYSRLEDADAITYYQKIDSIAERENLKGEVYIKALQNLGVLLMDAYGSEENYLDKSKQYLYKAADAAVKSGITEEIFVSKVYIASILNMEGNYPESVKLYQECISHFHKSGNNTELKNTLWGLAGTLENMGKIKEAENTLKEYLLVLESINHPNGVARGNWVLGHFYARNDQTSKAIFHMEAALEIFEKGETEDPGPHLSALFKLSELYKESNNPQKAYEFLWNAWVKNDAIQQGKNENLAKELESKYQSEKKEQEITLLKTENELSVQKQRVQLILIIAIILLAVLIYYFLYTKNKQKIILAERIRELDEMKSRFFSNISHEFRTPLTLISSSAQLLKEKDSESKHFQKDLSRISQQSGRLLELVDQLLELSKMEEGKLSLLLKEANLAVLIKAYSENYVHQAQESGLTFQMNIEESEKKQLVDPEVLKKILGNLLSNALKYSTQNGEILVDFHTKDGYMQLTISNSCDEIPQHELTKLFDRFYHKGTVGGTGIGLAMVKELIGLYGGRIIPKWTNGMLTMNLSIPVSIDTVPSHAIILESDSVRPEEMISPTSNLDEKPRIMIVDDNSDLRFLLEELFMEEFQVSLHADGQAALEAAIEEIPDLIISDITMERLDGISLCKKIKSEEITCHIPVILLTAQASEESQLLGLENQADAYIRKPFNNKILYSTVLQLLQERRMLKDRYSRELILKPIDIAINNLEEQFLEKMEVVITENLDNTEFTAEKFAEEMNLSRMQLHRKLKHLTGLSALEFIRNQRLKAAAELLKKGKTNISEVAYTVGYIDLSHFSKSFKALYGMTPTEFNKAL
ncbi:helix-turn-helix domain-containing protein [Belliella marina]|uniref:histidine kinase n=1 Tax=Belliella marina TaxID=1644146 RepID=A0ABW4VGZ2_9BACT